LPGCLTAFLLVADFGAGFDFGDFAFMLIPLVVCRDYRGSEGSNALFGLAIQWYVDGVGVYS
jgi:hypothetical protein